MLRAELLRGRGGCTCSRLGGSLIDSLWLCPSFEAAPLRSDTGGARLSGVMVRHKPAQKEYCDIKDVWCRGNTSRRSRDSTTNVDGIDAPPMRRTRPRFKSWHILDFCTDFLNFAMS